MVLGSCFESARAMLFLFILLNALPVPMLRHVKLRFLVERWDPRFCTPLQRFGLIMQGLVPPAGAKKREKTASKLSSFFDVETKAPKPLF